MLHQIWKHFRLDFLNCYPFKHQPHKMVKHTQTIRWLLPRNCLSVFDHFVKLALKGWILSFISMFHFNISSILEQRGVSRNLSNIYDGTIFAKKLHLRCLRGS